MLVLVLLIFCGLFGSSVVGVDEGKPQCGYKGCPVLPESSKGKKIVHLICHTHDDVGWVKTADQYFFGGRRDQNYFAVEQILDSVVSELLKNKNRRFVYVESAFLWRWWLLKEQSVREVFWKLVDEGRLQLLGGGWVMSDEATTHYSALIDQMTLGHKFLKNTFGECNLPRVAWQIDPFGHSSEVALEFAEMGFDGLFFSRMDYVEYIKRKANKSLEMIWQPDTREGANGDLFTGQTYDPLNPYHPPRGLNFDITSKDEPVIDNKLFHGYNVEKRAKDLMNAANEYAKAYKTKNVMLTMGGDFHYLVASSWFNNLDRLIKYVNKNSKEMYVIYSTPACYLKSLHESNTVWPVKRDDDFFPYGGTSTEIWSGYFTSRPSFKNLVYRANNFYQACKQLRFPLNESYEMEQFNMARAMGMAQHHDAVTGTQKSFVADDYAQYIEEGLAGCEKIAAATLSEWDTNHDKHKLSYQFCQKLNTAECVVSEKNANFFITVYNPQAHYKNHTVVLPVNLDSYKVTDSNASEIEFDLFPLPNEIKAIPGRKNYANSPHEMVFNVINLPPLGTKSFLVENIRKETPEVIQIQEYVLGQLKPITAINGDIKLNFDPASGLLASITRKNEKWEFSQNFFSYEPGYSGAYLFFAGSDAVPLTNKIDSISIAVGKNVVEVRQKFTSYVSQIIRLYKGKDEIEFNWLVGPIPREQQIITRYSTSKLTSTAAFYTDSNGRRFIKRERENSIERSYYPITIAAQLKDTNHKVTVITDRPQGAASLKNGELEIMLHRKLLRDDGKGVEEILDEIEYQVPLVVRGKHILQLSKLNESSTPADDSKNSAAYKHRIGAQDMVFTPIVSFAKATSSAIEHFKNDTNDMDYTGLMKVPLPDNIHLLTLERWDNSTVLVRLEHLFEPDEDPTYSKPTAVKLKELFSGYDIVTATEYSLAGTFEKTKMERLKWKNEKDSEDEKEKKDEKTEPLPSSMEVTLKPMQIRTFQLSLTRVVRIGSGSMALTPNFNMYILISLVYLLFLYFV